MNIRVIFVYAHQIFQNSIDLLTVDQWEHLQNVGLHYIMLFGYTFCIRAAAPKIFCVLKLYISAGSTISSVLDIKN